MWKMQGFYRNHMEEVIKFFETHHKVFLLNFVYTFPLILMIFVGLAMNLSSSVCLWKFLWIHSKVTKQYKSYHNIYYEWVNFKIFPDCHIFLVITIWNCQGKLSCWLDFFLCKFCFIWIIFRWGEKRPSGWKCPTLARNIVLILLLQCLIYE